MIEKNKPSAIFLWNAW